MVPARGRRFAGAQHQLSHETPELAPRRNLSDKKKRSGVLSTMPITVLMVVVMPLMPIRVVIVCVTRIVAGVIRPVVGWNTKSKSYMHSSLGLIRHPGNQTQRDER